MTPDGFLSLLALIFAALAFLPLVRQLHLRATLLGNLAWSIPALVLVLYLEFYGAVQLPCPAWYAAGLCSALTMSDASPISPRDAAFAVVLVWTAIMSGKYWKGAMPAGSLPVLRKIVERRLDARDYVTVIELIEPHLDLVDRAARRRLLRQRHYDWWSRRRAPDRPALPAFLLTDRPQAPVPPRRQRIRRWLRRMSGHLGRVFPTGSTLETAAEWIIERLLTDRGVRRYLAEHRPAFGARLMVLPGREANGFMEKFVTDLAGDTDSLLYQEIERSGGAGWTSQRTFGEHSPLLRALLNDASVADRIEAYTPIGEHYLARLNPANDRQYVESLKLRPDRFWSDIGRHSDTGFVTLTFFDLMVTNAAFQGVESHMWLMYTDHFAKALLAVHDETGADIDPDAEWPTRSSEMLYRIVDALTDWIELVLRLPETNIHCQVASSRPDQGEGKIPKSAIISLAYVLQQILLAPNVNESFKQYILNVAVRTLSKLPTTGDKAVFRRLLVRALAGDAAISRQLEFVAAVAALYGELDHMLRGKVPDFTAAIEAARPRQTPIPPFPAPLPTASGKKARRSRRWIRWLPPR